MFKRRKGPADEVSATELAEMGFKLVASGGTCAALREVGLTVERINKVMEGQPHIADAVINGQIDFIINTTKGPQAMSDSMSIRRQAVMHKIPYYTLLSAARAGVQAIRAMKYREMDVRPLQDYFKSAEETETDGSDVKAAVNG